MGMMVVYFFVRLEIRTSLGGSENSQILTVDNKSLQENSNNDKRPVALNSHTIIQNIIIIAFLLSGLFQAIYGLLQLYSVFPSLNSDFKITGSFANPAPFAMYLASIFPIIFYLTIFTNRNKYFFSFVRYLACATLLLIVIIIPATFNRASYLGLLCGSLLILFYQYDLWNKIKILLNNNLKRFSALVLVILLLGSTSYCLYHFKSKSSDGRILIWEIAYEKISENPIAGVGLNRFETNFGKWQAEWFAKGNGTSEDKMLAGNTKMALNEYFEILVETGFPGLMLFLLFVIYLLLKTKLNSISFPVFSSLICLLIFSFVSYPLLSLPTFILFCFFSGILSIFTSVVKLISYKIPLLIRTSFAMIFTITAFFIGYNQVVKIRTYKNWQAGLQAYYKGANSPSVILFKDAYPELKHNGEFLMNYGKILSTTGKYSESIDILETAKNIWSDPVLYTTLGDDYKWQKQFDKAEACYLLAVNMIPHKIYPKYLLAKLYYEQGQLIKAEEQANDILKMEAKVKSTAVDEIKSQMQKLINQINEKTRSEVL